MDVSNTMFSYTRDIQSACEGCMGHPISMRGMHGTSNQRARDACK